MKSQIEMAAESLEISVRSEYLPQTQKTTVLIGLRAGSDSPLKVQLWRSADTVWARAEGFSMIKVEINGSQQTAVEVSLVPPLVIRSDGIAAEWVGDSLGQYELRGELNNCPYYVQTDTLTSSPPTYLYRADNKEWYVSPVLGERKRWLRNPRDSECVPGDGWLVYRTDRCWTADPQCRVSPGPLSECGDITVSASPNSPTANKRPDCLGVFRPTDMFSSGRRVFKHQSREKYLCIPPGYTIWKITDTPGADSAGMRSAAGANCPASERNRFCDRDNVKSWMYSVNNQLKKDPSITVTCSKHSTNFY